MTERENIISAICKCGAVLQGGVWLKSEGARRKAMGMELPVKKCCGCKGAPECFGGFLGFSVLGHPKFGL